MLPDFTLSVELANPIPIEGYAIATVPASIIDAARMNENTFFIIKMNIKLFNFVEIREEVPNFEGHSGFPNRDKDIKF